jgi:hypothetical protein
MQTIRIGAGIRPFIIDQKTKADLDSTKPLGGIEVDLQAKVYLDMPSGLKNPSVISSGSAMEGLAPPHPGMEQSTPPQVGGAAANPRLAARSLSHPRDPETAMLLKHAPMQEGKQFCSVAGHNTAGMLMIPGPHGTYLNALAAS